MPIVPSGKELRAMPKISSEDGFEAWHDKANDGYWSKTPMGLIFIRAADIRRMADQLQGPADERQKEK